jgi:hypothetical protein
VLNGLLLVLAAGAVGLSTGCASKGGPEDDERFRQEEQRRDSPFYTPFSA